MNTKTPSYRGFRFPSEIISHTIWLYPRFCLSVREVEERLADHGITVTDETIRQWCQQFGPAFARKLNNPQAGWMTRDTSTKCSSPFKGNGSISDVRLSKIGHHRHFRAASSQSACAARFFRRLLQGQGTEPRWLVTTKLRSHDAAHRTIMPTVSHLNHIYANK